MTKKEQIHNYMQRQITLLLAQKNTSGGKARLANLRRGAGRYPGELPELWGVFLNDMPEELLSFNGKPSRAEWSVYLSLTMLALHQQGNSSDVHSEGISLGTAASRLMNEQKNEEYMRVLRRFAPVVTAKDMPEFAHHLRCLIQLFSSKDIKLDYVKLAEDIFDFQSDDKRRNVQLRWGEDFYRKKGE